MSFWKRLFGRKTTESVLKLNLQDAPPIRATSVGEHDSAPALPSKQQKAPLPQQEAQHSSASDMSSDKSAVALTPEQQKAMWLDPLTLELLSSSSAVFTLGASGVSEQQVSPEVATWAKPLVDSIQEADALARNGHYEEAIMIYRQVLKKAPDAAIVLMSIGSCYANLGVKETALIWFRRALKAAPSNERIRRNLAIIERM